MPLAPGPTGSDPPGTGRAGKHGTKDAIMSKGMSKGNKEAKKPKKVVAKVLATAQSGGKDGTTIAGKKVK